MGKSRYFVWRSEWSRYGTKPYRYWVRDVNPFGGLVYRIYYV